MALDAQAAGEAYEAWAKSQITSISADRLEIAKFFFAASTASLGFFIAVWQFHHKDANLRGIDIYALAFLGASVLWSMVIFWPITYDFRLNADLHKLHQETLNRIKVEGAVWSGLWIAGALLAVIATFLK